MAKGIGNGIPLAAVATRKEIAEKMSKKLHFNTFGGNALSCVIGLEVLKIIEEDNLLENVKVEGAYMKKRLLAMKDKFEIVGDIRGKGFMLGMEIVMDKKSKIENTKAALNFSERCKDYGLLICRGGLKGNTVRVIPMFNSKHEDLVFAMDVFERALEEV